MPPLEIEPGDCQACRARAEARSIDLVVEPLGDHVAQLGVVTEVGAVALGAHLAQVEHVHVVRGRHALAHVLVDQDHGDAGPGQGLDDVVDLARPPQD